MGIFQKLGSWLTDRSDRFIRGSEAENGYYATQEAQRAYSGMGRQAPEEPEAEEGEPDA